MKELLLSTVLSIGLLSSGYAMDEVALSNSGKEAQALLKEIENDIPGRAWNDGHELIVKDCLSPLSYFDLVQLEFQSWIGGQARHIQNWYEDSVNKALSDLYTSFLRQRAEPTYPEMTGSLRILKTDVVTAPVLAYQKNSSGKNCDCLLYSIIGENEALLTRILGNSELAKELLSVPEYPDSSPLDVPEKRDFTVVREKILADIGNILDQDSRSSKFIREILKDPVEDSGANGINDYLAYLSPDYSRMLPQEMAFIISDLYGMNVQVYKPDAYNRESEVLVPSLTLTADQAAVYRPTGEPIYVFHKGFGGYHYQKLFTLEF